MYFKNSAYVDTWYSSVIYVFCTTLQVRQSWKICSGENSVLGPIFQEKCSGSKQNFQKKWTGAENLVLDKVLQFSQYRAISNHFSSISSTCHVMMIQMCLHCSYVHASVKLCNDVIEQIILIVNQLLAMILLAVVITVETYCKSITVSCKTNLYWEAGEPYSY